MCKFSSKSGGVPFQILFFLGDLTRNDPYSTVRTYDQNYYPWAMPETNLVYAPGYDHI